MISRRNRLFIHRTVAEMIRAGVFGPRRSLLDDIRAEAERIHDAPSLSLERPTVVYTSRRRFDQICRFTGRCSLEEVAEFLGFDRCVIVEPDRSDLS